MQELEEIAEDGDLIKKLRKTYMGSEEQIQDAMNKERDSFIRDLSKNYQSVKEQRYQKIKGSDRCPCGSGKLFKNCHRRKAVKL